MPAGIEWVEQSVCVFVMCSVYNCSVSVGMSCHTSKSLLGSFIIYYSDATRSRVSIALKIYCAIEISIVCLQRNIP